MSKRLALGFLTLAPIIVLGLLLTTPMWGRWLLAVVAMSFPIALVTLATARGDGVGRLRAPFVVLFLMLQAGAVGVLVLTGSSSGGLAGLPTSLLFLLGFVWLGPLLVTTVSYAVFFPELGIDDALLEQLDEIREHRDA